MDFPYFVVYLTSSNNTACGKGAGHDLTVVATASSILDPSVRVLCGPR